MEYKPLVEELGLFEEQDFLDFFNSLTYDKANFYGFSRYKGTDLYLIPETFLDFIPIGIKLKDLIGNNIIYNGKNLDLDSRGGFLGYGINLETPYEDGQLLNVSKIKEEFVLNRLESTFGHYVYYSPSKKFKVILNDGSLYGKLIKVK